MNLRYGLHKTFWRAVDYVYPPVCAACGVANYRLCPACLDQIHLINYKFCAFCGKRIHGSQSVCKECAQTPVHFDAATAWGEYSGVLRDAIHALKYKTDLGLGDLFADYLIKVILDIKWEFDYVVPVPLSKQRMKERAYNQSVLLSRPIAQFFGLPHSMSALNRIKETGSQIQRGKIDRNLALENAFWGNPAKLKGRKVLLVDDIITTGATINHCSAALRKAGAEKVYAISIAKTFKTKP